MSNPPSTNQNQKPKEEPVIRGLDMTRDEVIAVQLYAALLVKFGNTEMKRLAGEARVATLHITEEFKNIEHVRKLANS